MTHQTAYKLSFGRKTLLTSLAVATIAAPFFVGVVNAPRVNAQANGTLVASNSSLELVSLKQNRSDSQMNFFRSSPTGLTITNSTVKNLIQNAYHVKDYQLSGGPSWLDTERYDIELKRVGTSENSPSGDPKVTNLDIALKRVLEEQFHLTMNSGTAEMPGYALVVADSGPTLTEMPTQLSGSSKEPLTNSKTMVRNGSGQLSMTGHISVLVDALSANLGEQIVDKTGLKGNYDVMLHWSKSPNEVESLSVALQEQLGLKLEAQQQLVQTLSVSQVEIPAEK